MDTGHRVTGFYFQTTDGKFLEFRDIIDPTSDHFKELAKDDRPGRYDLITLTRAEVAERDTVSSSTSTLPLSKVSFKAIIDDRNVDRVGLILVDGRRTETGPLGYQEDFASDPGSQE